MHSTGWTVSSTLPSAQNLLQSLVTVSPYLCTWNTRIRLIETLDALDASNLILIYENDTPTLCLGSRPSGSSYDSTTMNNEDNNPLHIQVYKPCFGLRPSGSSSNSITMNNEDNNPLHIRAYKKSRTDSGSDSDNPIRRYIISVLYYRHEALVIQSVSPMTGEKAISAMIAVLVYELEMTMERGEQLKKPSKPLEKIQDKNEKKKTGKGSTPQKSRSRKTKKRSAAKDV